MKNLGLFFLFLMALSIIACNKKEGDDVPGDVTRTIDMRVPDGFLFENSSQVRYRITVSDETFGAIAHRVTIYEGNPLEGGSILAIGAASVSRPMVGNLDLSKIAQDIYISKKSPNGDISIRKAMLSSGIIEMDFANFMEDRMASRNQSPDCTTGCDNTHSSGDVNASNNSGVTCIPGPFNGSITIGNNATVRICGNATITNLNINSNSGQLIITFSGNATFSSSVSYNGLIHNWGQATFSQNLTSNNNGDLINDGSISINQNLTINRLFENNGQTSVGNQFANNNNTNVKNYCSITVGGTGTLNGTVDNYGYFGISGNVVVQGNNQPIKLHNASMLTTNNLTINKLIEGIGAKSLVKVNGTTTLNSGGSLQGNLEYCQTSGNNPSGNIGPNVSFGCDLYIPSNSCNPVGNGSLPDDGDGDGIPDDLDDFPDDPTGAFGNYFPSPSGVHTLVFEDLWPAYGDYDMNDLVIDFRYQMVMNGSNQVTSLLARYELRAAGAANSLGFGVELPIARSAVASVNGGVLEPNQTNAVIIVFADSKQHMPSFNTIPGNPPAGPVIFEIEIVLANPVPTSQFGLGVYNPFIWNATIGRGHEIHLPGKPPTNLANTSIFGTVKDASTPNGNFYRSVDQLPWGLYIPSKFDYPIEKADIVKAYLNFSTWVESGGANNQNWFLNQSGNTDPTNIY